MGRERLVLCLCVCVCVCVCVFLWLVSLGFIFYFVCHSSIILFLTVIFCLLPQCAHLSLLLLCLPSIFTQFGAFRNSRACQYVVLFSNPKY